MTTSPSEAAERVSRPQLNSIVAVLVALTGTFMAVAGVKDGNIGAAMAEAQARAIDTWAYYQAKSMKQSFSEVTIDQLAALRAVSVDRTESLAVLDRNIAEHRARAIRYENEKNEIKAEAERYEKTYRELGLRGDQFDLSSASLSIAVALFGITALTQKRGLLAFALVIMLIGMFFGLSGFLGWTFRPAILARALL